MGRRIFFPVFLEKRMGIHGLRRALYLGLYLSGVLASSFLIPRDPLLPRRQLQLVLVVVVVASSFFLCSCSSSRACCPLTFLGGSSPFDLNKE